MSNNLPVKTTRHLPNPKGGSFKLSPEERMARREGQRLAHEAVPFLMQRLINIASGRERGWSNAQQMAALNSVLDRAGVGRQVRIEAEDTGKPVEQLTGEDMAQWVKQIMQGTAVDPTPLSEILTELRLPEGTSDWDTVTAGHMWCAKMLQLHPRSDRNTIALAIAEARGAQHPLVYQINAMFEAVENIRRRVEEMPPASEPEDEAQS